MSNTPSNRKSNLRNEIKGPDSFQTKALESFSFVEKHQPLILKILAACAVIAAIIWSVGYMKKQGQAKVADKLAVVEKVYNDELKAADDKRKVIQDKLAKLMPKDEAAGEPPQATKDEMERLEKELGAIKPDHSKSSEQFGGFYKENPKDPSGLMAGMRYATFLVGQDKKPEAKKILEDIIADSKDFPLYQIHGRFGLINVLEDLGEFEPAIKVAGDLLPIVPKELISKVLLIKGRLLFEQKKSAEAITTLDTLLKDHATSMEADAARSLRALIQRG